MGRTGHWSCRAVVASFLLPLTQQTCSRSNVAIVGYVERSYLLHTAACIVVVVVVLHTSMPYAACFMAQSPYPLPLSWLEASMCPCLCVGVAFGDRLPLTQRYNLAVHSESHCRRMYSYACAHMYTCVSRCNFVWVLAFRFLKMRWVF